MTSNIHEFVEEEDDDVVLQGSELHTILTNMGYSDFQSVPVQKIDKTENVNSINAKDLCNKVGLSMNQKIFSFIYNSILCTTQDNHFLNEQLRIILRLDCLLDDHTSKIQSFVEERKPCLWMKSIYWLPLLSSPIVVLNEFSKKSKNLLNIILASSIMSLTSLRKFLRWRASTNLRQLICLQNEFYHSCKKCLKILRYSFRMKMDSKKTGQKFIELEKSKQMYLPELTEILIGSLEKMSIAYYQASNCILKFLPSSIDTEDLITIFESDAFALKGEVTYQTLKNLYYTYLLVQSEMLYLLAIAYNRKTWQNFGGCPEIKLLHIINNLIMSLEKPCSKLSKVLNEYSTKKIVPQHREFKGSKASKWQDLYVHLDLTAYKLQSAYKVIISTLEEIDCDTNLNENISETIMRNLDEVYKQIDTARSFTEFSSLLVAKVQHEQSKGKHFKEHDFIPEKMESDLPVVLDSEPQIVDEVFEEYIKEEYLKPLYEDGDESIMQNYKFDKLLAKNFMCELKDALLEKHKSMSERESKALQRMYKNVTQEVSSKQEDGSREKLNLIPSFVHSVNSVNNEVKKVEYVASDYLKCEDLGGKIYLAEENDSENVKDFEQEKIVLKRLPTFYENEDQKDDEINVQRFSMIECKPKFPLFLKVSEETFIGSGENSDDELILNEVDNVET